MVKKLFNILILLIIFLIPINAFAISDKNYIEDNANVFNTQIIEKYNKISDEINSEYSIPVFLYTTNENLGSDVRSNADYLLMDRVGKNNDGILLLIDYYNSELWLSYSGKAIDIIDDKRRDNLLDKLYVNVRNNVNNVISDYYSISKGYIQSGPRVGQYREHEKSLSLIDIAIAAITAIIAYLISFNAIKSGSTPRYKKYVYPLLANTALNLAVNSSNLINTSRSVSRIVRSNNSSGGGYKSSTHKTGGGIFGGGGRKF